MNKKLLWIPIGIIIIGIVAHFILKGCHDVEPGHIFEAQVPNEEIADQTDFKAFELFVDFSGSMKGYVDFSNVVDGANARSEMKSTVTTFLDKVEAKYHVKTNCHVNDNRCLEKDAFRRALEDKSVFCTGETLLHKMLENICTNANDTTVITIVSDLVLSFGKNKIILEKDVYYNKHHLDDLSAAIHSAMMGLKSKGLDVLLLQYYCDFNGKYYYNYTENIEGTNAYMNQLMKNRPFYVLLIGKEQYLKGILAKDCIEDAKNVYASFIIKDSDLKIAQFSIEQDSSTNFWTLGNAEGKGGFWTSSDLGSDKTKFNISCQDFKIPAYLNKKSLTANCSEGLVSSIDYDDQYKTLKFSIETKPFKDLKKITNLKVEIVSTNEWRGDASIKDDDDVNKDLVELEGRTWGLRHIIDAIDKAYHDKSISEGAVVGHFSFDLIKK